MSSGGSFADPKVPLKSRGSTKLEKIHAIVNWSRYDYRLKKIFDRSGLGPNGYHPIQLFQVLVLQNLYGLSDPETEDIPYDHISFRRFCNHSLKGRTPDETRICRFRLTFEGHTGKLLQ